MLLVLLTSITLAPLYWLVVPERGRRTALSLASLVGLGLVDPRLPILLLGFNAALFLLLRSLGSGGRWRTSTILLGSLAALVTLFVWNKLAGGGGGELPSQGGLVLLGISYLVLKAAAALIEAARGARREFGFSDLLAWIVFLPTYPAGPIEEYDHFHPQRPQLDWKRAWGGLERILFGLVKAVILAHYLGEWANPILASPEGRGPGLLLLGLYAFTLRFYLDFAGYSDIAIGIAALFGYEIQENFDRPLVQRNLVQLWQRWHMTLTRWLRTYIFVPASRAIMRRGGARLDLVAVVVAQLAAMTFCGLWHGLGWNFAVWGLLQGLGLVWVGLAAEPLGRRLPAGVSTWWRKSRLAFALSTALTFHYFALSNVLVVADIEAAVVYLGLLFGG